MEYIDLHPLKKKVSCLGLGTWAIGGWMWGGTDEQDALSTIREAIDLGFTLIDTAPIYGNGKSEELVGKAVKASGKRDQLILATKTGLLMQGEDVVINNSKKEILKQVEQSLKRLQTDVIDLYQIHWPDDTPISEMAEAMDLLLKQGKIKAIGLSNFSAQQLAEFLTKAPIHAIQPPYNIFERGIEKDVLPFAKKNHIPVLGYSSLCRGLLSGKIDKNTRFKGDDGRKQDPKYQEPRFSSYLEAVQKLGELAKKHQKSLIALSIRYCFDKGIDIPLWGARKPSQLMGIDEVFGWKLSESDFKEIDKILSEIKSPVGPEYMAPKQTVKV